MLHDEIAGFNYNILDISHHSHLAVASSLPPHAAERHAGRQRRGGSTAGADWSILEGSQSEEMAPRWGHRETHDTKGCSTLHCTIEAQGGQMAAPAFW